MINYKNIGGEAARCGDSGIVMPDDEHKLLLARDRGQKADALLENALLKEAFATLEADYIDAWKSNERSMGPEGRERLWNAVQIIGKVRMHLRQVATDGHTAARFLDDLHPNKL